MCVCVCMSASPPLLYSLPVDGVVTLCHPQGSDVLGVDAPPSVSSSRAPSPPVFPPLLMCVYN